MQQTYILQQQPTTKKEKHMAKQIFSAVSLMPTFQLSVSRTEAIAVNTSSMAERNYSFWMQLQFEDGTCWKA